MKPWLAAVLAPIVLAAPALAEPVQIDGSGMSRDFACEDGQDVSIAGAEHKVVLTGRCGVVSVQGANHTVSFEAASALEVSGISNTVAGGTTGSLVVEAAKNRITATVKAAETGKVEVSGAEHRLELTFASPVRIEVQGARNTLEWRAESGVKAPSVSTSGIENRISRR